VTVIEDVLVGMTASRWMKLGNCPNLGWRDDVSGGMEMLSHRNLAAGKSDAFRRFLVAGKVNYLAYFRLESDLTNSILDGYLN
jgi:hypothetical protein